MLIDFSCVGGEIVKAKRVNVPSKPAALPTAPVLAFRAVAK